jgi:hypothetical protein
MHKDATEKKACTKPACQINWKKRDILGSKTSNTLVNNEMQRKMSGHIEHE